MTFGLNTLMLVGLAGLAIPILIHLLNRRRYDVVHWGAMQFLQISETTRKRLLIEELLLMLYRMVLIALLVLGLAAPFLISALLDPVGHHENRDVVLIFDGSDSMTFQDGDRSVHEAARAWAERFLDGLQPGDRVAVLQAKQQVIPVVGEPTHDLEHVRQALKELAPPRGTADLPLALQTAGQLLQAGQRPRRDVILLTDGQRFGWADEATKRRWKAVADQLGDDLPRVWAVNLAPNRPAEVANWSFGRLHAGRALATPRVGFDAELRVRGQTYAPPHRLRVEVDGQPVSDLTPPTADKLRDGQVPLAFIQPFTGPGSHLISLIVEADEPGQTSRDKVPGDNRQDFAVMLPLVPVLLVDGAPRQRERVQGADFLQAALLPAGGQGLARAHVVPAEAFEPALLTQPVGAEPESRPRVLVLCDVPSLTPAQQGAVEAFLNEGGGVLVTLGPRVRRDEYNRQLYRGGEGWLPAGLAEVRGDENEPVPTDDTTPDPAPHPALATFAHPALELFRRPTSAGLGKARFPRWWKVDPAAGSSAGIAARLTNGDPLLVERSVGKGRVVLCCVPLDDSWGTNLHRDVPEFPLLAHELVWYLAGVRATDYNLVPGQPIQYQPAADEAVGTMLVQPPHGEAKTVPVERWPFVYRETREPGIYRLKTPAGRTIYYVVQADTRDGDDLVPCSAPERDEVAGLVPLTYADEPAAVLAAPHQAFELWWLFLIGLIALLCGEVWLTRRMALRRV